LSSFSCVRRAGTSRGRVAVRAFDQRRRRLPNLSLHRHYVDLTAYFAMCDAEGTVRKERFDHAVRVGDRARRYLWPKWVSVAEIRAISADDNTLPADRRLQPISPGRSLRRVPSHVDRAADGDTQSAGAGVIVGGRSANRRHFTQEEGGSFPPPAAGRKVGELL